MKWTIFTAALALWLGVVVLSGYFGIAPIYVDTFQRHYPSMTRSLVPAAFGVLYFGIPYLLAALLTAIGTAVLCRWSTAAAVLLLVPAAVLIFAISESVFVNILASGGFEMHDSSSHPFIAAVAGFLFAFLLASTIVVRSAYRWLGAKRAPSNSA